MLYHLYELNHALLTPFRMWAEATKLAFNNPFNPLSHIPAGRTLAAGAELFERVTRKFGKPIFGLDTTTIDGRKIEIEEEFVLEKPFCNLIHFKRKTKRTDPKILIVAPISGHYATLLRGTVEALLPHHDVYITDWIDARQVPLTEGKFNLDTFMEYVIDFTQFLGENTHIVAVCQPAPGTLAATAIMNSYKKYIKPASMTLMGGPIDTRVNKTEVTKLAEDRPLSWFENTVTTHVPAYYPGAFRKVYPGFLQLGGFMSMNLDRHVGSHMEFYKHLVTGDGDSADAHKKFYNEYLAVMDLPAEFYLQTVELIFQKHVLPDGTMKWKDPKTEKLIDVKPEKITETALLTIEGERDDISAFGQTTAAHDICSGIPTKRQFHHLQMKVGHYGIFNGSRWRTEIMPRLRNFIRQVDKSKYSPLPSADLKKVPDLAAEQFDPYKHGPNPKAKSGGKGKRPDLKLVKNG